MPQQFNTELKTHLRPKLVRNKSAYAETLLRDFGYAAEDFPVTTEPNDTKFDFHGISARRTGVIVMGRKLEHNGVSLVDVLTWTANRTRSATFLITHSTAATPQTTMHQVRFEDKERDTFTIVQTVDFDQDKLALKALRYAVNDIEQAVPRPI
jgi:hypothetical protein